MREQQNLMSADLDHALYTDVARRCAARGGTAMLIGAVDSGKTTMAARIAAAGAVVGRRVATVDADLGQSTIGPPATIGLRASDRDGDRLYMVGSLSPPRRPATYLTGIVALVRAGAAQADLVVLDMPGHVAGAAAQTLLAHVLELAAPETVIGLQRDGELAPLLRLARTLGTAEVVTLPVAAMVRRRSPAERAAYRRGALRTYLANGDEASSWRGLPSVDVRVPDLLPLPRLDADLSLVDGVLVGVSGRPDGFHTVAVAEAAGEGVRVHLPANAPRVAAPPVRLGTVRLDDEWNLTEVDVSGLTRSVVRRARR